LRSRQSAEWFPGGYNFLFSPPATPSPIRADP
jgi:hypothetical protein